MVFQLIYSRNIVTELVVQDITRVWHADWYGFELVQINYTRYAENIPPTPILFYFIKKKTPILFYSSLVVEKKTFSARAFKEERMTDVFLSTQCVSTELVSKKLRLNHEKHDWKTTYFV